MEKIQRIVERYKTYIGMRDVVVVNKTLQD